MIPVMFNIYGRIPFNNVDKAEVFAVRIGWGLNYANASSDLYSVKSGWGSQLNIGTDIWISDNVSIGADVFYMFVFAQYYYVYENAYYGNSIDAYASFIGLVSLKYHFL